MEVVDCASCPAAGDYQNFYQSKPITHSQLVLTSTFVVSGLRVRHGQFDMRPKRLVCLAAVIRRFRFSRWLAPMIPREMYVLCISNDISRNQHIIQLKSPLEIQEVSGHHLLDGIENLSHSAGISGLTALAVGVWFQPILHHHIPVAALRSHL